jgi:hypothetical protein
MFSLKKKIKLVIIALLKEIVSRDLGALYLISLDRNEIINRAGSGLFIILRTFQCGKKWKWTFALKSIWSYKS